MPPPQEPEPCKIESWIEFFQSQSLRSRPGRNYVQDIHALVNIFPERRSLEVDYDDINYFDMELADKLLKNPDEEFQAAEAAIFRLCPADARSAIHFRPFNLPTQTNIYNMETKIGKLVSVEVTVSTVRQKYLLLKVGLFKCSRCGYETVLFQDYPNFTEPIVCGNESCGRAASATTFILIREKSEFIEAEDMTIEDPWDTIKADQPFEMECLATDDLCQKVVAGQRVILNAIVRANQRNVQGKKSVRYIPYLDIVSIENLDERYDLIDISPEDEQRILQLAQLGDIRTRIRNSIAPFIYGLPQIKDGIALQMFGGVEKSTPGHRQRGDIHILLIGDPGTGKSEILKWVAKASPKGHMTSGKNASQAGLTATAENVNDQGWKLTAGFLPKCDRGLAAIDEFNRMRDSDRESIHEAMEQGTLSITKAGINAVLNCRCAILAAANPTDDRWRNDQPPIQQIDVPPALRSRFALINIIEDKIDAIMDRNLANFILSNSSDLATTEGVDADVAQQRVQPPVSMELLKKYIAYARQRYNPRLPEPCRKLIADFYVAERGKCLSEDAPFQRVALTARQIEDLQRLSEAAARMRLCNEVSTEDVDWAFRLYTGYLEKMAKDPRTGMIDIDMIYSGTTTRTKNSLAQVLEISRIEQANFEDGVPLIAVKDKAQVYNLSPKEVDDAIDVLVDKGEVYLTGFGNERVKVTRR